MAEENEVTANKLAEENQLTTKDPKEPQQVTAKNLKKVEAGKRLAVHNRRRREEKRREEKRRKEERRGGAEERIEPILQHWGCPSCRGDRWSWLLHLPSQESPATTYSTK